MNILSSNPQYLETYNQISFNGYLNEMSKLHKIIPHTANDRESFYCTLVWGLKDWLAGLRYK